jgi:hypothetical protein
MSPAFLREATLILNISAHIALKRSRGAVIGRSARFNSRSLMTAGVPAAHVHGLL